MNNLMTNIIRPAFLAIALLAALALTACGGGDSGGDTLAAGKVGTVGDGVNAAEYEAIQCGMNKDQVLAITGDAPNKVLGTGMQWDLTDPYAAVIFTDAGLVREKAIGKKGQANPIAHTVC